MHWPPPKILSPTPGKRGAGYSSRACDGSIEKLYRHRIDQSNERRRQRRHFVAVGATKASQRSRRNAQTPAEIKICAVPCERLVAQDSKGGERDGNLDDDRADRQEPDFALSLFVHGLPNTQGHGSIPTYWEKGRS